MNAPTQATPTVEKKKIAVVVIHGMGEQKPMQTLRDFVESVWQHDRNLFKDLKDPPDHWNWDTWSKPDQLSGSAELRRITTARARDPDHKGEKGKRTDFFELYWADLTADSNWGDFTKWFGALLFRNPFRGEIPPRVMTVWMVMWLFTLALLFSGLSTVWPKVVEFYQHDPLAGTWLGSLMTWRGWILVTVLLAAFGGKAKSFLTSYFGDVARYVSAEPRNIRVRHEARLRGLKLLDQIAASGAYDRVIVVGHSLGSVLAHDLVMLAWSEAARSITMRIGSSLHQAFRDCEIAGEALLDAAGYTKGHAPDIHRDDRGGQCAYGRSSAAMDKVPDLRDTYRVAQRKLFLELSAVQVQGPDQKRRSAWLISDLITMGCPLTHAEFLIARSLCELRVMVQARETLRCPPVFEAYEKLDLHFLYPNPKGSQQLQPHHAAAMAPTRWTNIHDPSGLVLFPFGDLISGPLARDFGPGVTDVAVCIGRPRGWMSWIGLSHFFTHVLYWKDFIRNAGSSEPPPDHVQVLRDAINFLGEPEVEARLMKRSRGE